MLSNWKNWGDPLSYDLGCGALCQNQQNRRESYTMVKSTESESRRLLGRLRDAMAEDSAGQTRLDKITNLTASSMDTEVCSIYLFRDEDTLELCATQGLNPEAVHKTRMRLGEGLVDVWPAAIGW